MLPTFDRDTDVSSAFLTFLRHAAAARQNGAADTAARWLDAASRLWPLDEPSLDLFSGRLSDRQRHDEAIELAAIIAQLDPAHAPAHFRLGHALQMANRHRGAIGPYRRALSLDPTLPRLRNNLAGALMLTGGDAREQLALLESAVQNDPGDGDAWTNLAHAYRMAMDLPRALDAGAAAVRCAPHSPLALNNHALALREAQRWDDADEAAQSACAAAPGNATMRSNLAMLQLMRGNYAAGWQSHEARWDGSAELGGNRPAFPVPTWRGEPLAGKTLLVWGEQGMGDVLQFSRYIPMLADRVHREGGRVFWNSFPQMGALLTRSFGNHVDAYSSSAKVESLMPFDYEIPLLSLPSIFDTRDTSIPAPTAYLRADETARESWRVRMNKETRLKVGLTWTGSIGHQRNPFRRVGWERYAAHFGAMRNVAFYSLQPGADADVAAARAAGFAITDFTAEFATFDDTAAFVSTLDLVITVCTSAAHLSGALGQRTWILLDVNPHWVWQLDRRDSPWYSSAKLYRQPRFGQWEPVLAEVAGDLNALAMKHSEA
ncbi:tetratricopeptide repeat protein [Paraburkholderia sp. D15]|uniref:tetratricopeptide repeat protein n=1 Tax=Paraburkholderia sp. D15 TaxID=2880218 RepID=UPI00247A8CE9|nr:tetratricopeptide repeat protein [Paraburkholderia sp. D15]WGS51892.1 tetratricopeptide repeat protein [Paraburkholderia sp. D15]